MARLTAPKIHSFIRSFEQQSKAEMFMESIEEAIDREEVINEDDSGERRSYQ